MSSFRKEIASFFQFPSEFKSRSHFSIGIIRELKLCEKTSWSRNKYFLSWKTLKHETSSHPIEAINLRFLRKYIKKFNVYGCEIPLELFGRFGGDMARESTKHTDSITREQKQLEICSIYTKKKRCVIKFCTSISRQNQNLSYVSKYPIGHYFSGEIRAYPLIACGPSIRSFTSWHSSSLHISLYLMTGFKGIIISGTKQKKVRGCWG